jgi:hypothetical protein
MVELNLDKGDLKVEISLSGKGNKGKCSESEFQKRIAFI